MIVEVSKMATLLKEPELRRAHVWETTRGRRNVGGVERGARLAIGAGAAAGAVVLGNIWLKALLGVLSAAGLLTGVVGYCPGNRAAGRDSYHPPK